MGIRRQRLAQRRKIVGLSQEGLAGRLAVDRSTVARWEAGDTEPQPWLRPKLADFLKISVDQLDGLLAVHKHRVEQFELADGFQGPQRKAAEPSPASRGPSMLVEELADSTSHTNSAISAMRAFRAADRNVGSRHLYGIVVAYLTDKLGPQLLGTNERDVRAVFTEVAALSDMAGWMAHDSGKNHYAHQHFSRASGFAKLGNDQQLGVHIRTSMSHLALHDNEPYKASEHARLGRTELHRGDPQPMLESRLLAMQACSFADMQRPSECGALLMRAEDELTRPAATAPSLWTSTFDEGSLAAESARCMQALGRLASAQRHAERILQVRSEPTRSRAFGQLLLASILIRRGCLDEACALGNEVLDQTRQLGSYLVVEQLVGLERALAPSCDSRPVRAFLDNLNEAINERGWLHHPLVDEDQYIDDEGRM